MSSNMMNDIHRAEKMGINLIRLSDLNLVQIYATELQHNRLDEIPRSIRRTLRGLGAISRSRSRGSTWKITAYGLELLKENKKR